MTGLPGPIRAAVSAAGAVGLTAVVLATGLAAGSPPAGAAPTSASGRDRTDRPSERSQPVVAVRARSVRPGPLASGGYLGGSSSPAAIASLQRALARAGLPTRADGVFGARTRRAVARFQRASRLRVDGLVGRQTMSALREAGARTAGCRRRGGCRAQAGAARLDAQGGARRPAGDEDGRRALAAGAGTRGPGAPGRPRAAREVPDRYIVVFRGKVPSVRTKTERLERAEGFRAGIRFDRALKGFAGRLSDRQLDEVRADPDVAFVSPDRPVKAFGEAPLASGDEAPAGARRIRAATATTTREASTARVAVLDTGIDLTHPDLNAEEGKSCVAGATAQDDEGHGTHVAGTIAARNNGSGVVGVAPDTSLRAVKVLDSQGSGTISQVICGIDWVTSTRKDADPGNDIAVANLSLGGTGEPVRSCATTTDPMHKAICASTAAGVHYVVAAGNDGRDFDYPSAPDTPAAYPEVLTVTAMSDSDGAPGAAGPAPCRAGEADDRYASFSNYAAGSAGQAHTISGPGVCVRSTLLGGGYGNMSGTSMAAPHLAGAVALCLSEAGARGPCHGLSPAEVIAEARAEAERNARAAAGYGFAGDPSRALAGRYFGYLESTGVDTSAPTIITASPADRASGVRSDASVTVKFSEAMDRPSAQAAFSLRAPDGAPLAGSFTWSANTMTFRPSRTLGPASTYATSVATGAKDASGNPLSSTRSSRFTTAAAPARPPATAPAPAPPAPRPRATPDRTPPRVAFRLLARQRLAVVLRRHLRSSLTCSEACDFEVAVVVDGAIARRLGLASGRRPARLARAGGRASAGRATRVAIPLAARARRRLRGLRRFTGRVTVRAVDRQGNVTRLSRRLVLRR